MNTDSLQRHLKWLVPVLIVAVAAFFRLYHLDRVPPAFNFDEAAHATDALEILAGHHFIFSPKIGGVETGFMYLTAGMFALLGAQPLSQRLIAALIGIGTVAAVFFLVRTLFADTTERRRTWLAALTALGLAVSFWHVNYSRIGLEVNATPFFAVLSFWFLWRGLRSGKGWDFAWSGVWLGLGAYGHLPTRFLPFPILAFFVLMWMFGRTRPAPEGGVGGRRFLPLLLIAAVALIVSAPLGYYFVSHPADFVGRASSASIFNPAMHHGDLWGTLWRSAIGTIGAFGFTADRVWIANLPGKSILNPVLAILFWLGIVIALVRALRRPFDSKSRVGPDAPYLFALLWWGLLLLPAIITPERTPHFSRMMAVAPVAYLFPPIALVALATELGAALHPMRTLWFSVVDPELRFAIGYPDHSPAWQRMLQRGLAVSGYAAVAALFAWTALSTYHDYFDVWAASPAHYMTFDGYATELVAVMEADRDPLSVYVLPRDVRAGDFYPHYTIDFLHTAGAPHRYLPMREPEVPALLTEAVRGKQTVHLVKWKMDKHREADPKDYAAWLLEVYGRRSGSRSFDAYDIVTYRLPTANVDFAERSPEPAYPTAPAFGLPGGAEQIALDRAAIGNASSAGFDARHDVPSGGELWVAVQWRALATTSRDYRVSIILGDGAGHVLTHIDRDLIHGWHMRTSGWPPGEPVQDYYLLPVPPGTLPGPYRVLAAVYDAELQQRLPLDGAGRTTAQIGEVHVVPPADPVVVDAPRVRLGDGASCPEQTGMLLDGMDLDLSRTYAPGERLTVATTWLKQRAAGADCGYEFALEMSGAEASLAAPRVVGDKTYPGRLWRPDEQFRSLDDLRIPPAASPGTHPVRLHLSSGEVTRTVTLGEMRVEGRARSFDVPIVQHAARADFDRVARLLGYALEEESARPGGSVALTLYWQALGETRTSYTVFVHLLDSSNRVAAQHDAPPLNGEAPTSGWLPGEIVSDRVELALDPSLAAGRYQLEVGLYEPAGGERLMNGNEDRALLGEVMVR